MLHTIKESRKESRNDATGTKAEKLAERPLVENTLVSGPKEQLADHVAVLRTYASRVLNQDEPLQPWEEIDKAARIIELFALGNSFECTHRDLVKVLYRDLHKAGNR